MFVIYFFNIFFFFSYSIEFLSISTRIAKEERKKMSFIEGFLSIAQGDEKFVKQWCKVDKSEFCWCTNEGDTTMLGTRDLSKGGAIYVQKAAQRFDINVAADGATGGGGGVLQCTALSGAELDGWLDFFLKETSLKQVNSAAALAGATRTVSTTNLSSQLSKAAEKSLDRTTITSLIEDAIAREDFEICVQYRQYKRVRLVFVFFFCSTNLTNFFLFFFCSLFCFFGINCCIYLFLLLDSRRH